MGIKRAHGSGAVQMNLDGFERRRFCKPRSYSRAFLVLGAPNRREGVHQDFNVQRFPLI
jgi:hypothetical protein